MNSFIGWMGGKSVLAPVIVKQFPEHKTYVEPFGGAAWVLFNKNPGFVEVYNDIDSNLVNLFRVVKHRPAELVEHLNLVLFSRKTHAQFKKKLEIGDEDEVVMAAIFLYLVKSSFASQPFASFYSSGKAKAKKMQKLDFLKQVQARLERVYIESKSWEEIIGTFDSPETLFYLDPPYLIHGKKFYEHGLNVAGHFALRDHIKTMQGKFILSLNDTDETRKLYDGFNIQSTEKIRYRTANKTVKKTMKSEIIIKNF